MVFNICQKLDFLFMVTLAPAYVLAVNRRFKSSFSLPRTIMDVEPITTVSPDLEHPDDAQYIWLPILVLVGVVLLAGLVYVMSRSRRSFNFICFKRRNATRNGYTNVDDDDSDVSMAGADGPNAITSLLDSRLHIEPVPLTGSRAQSNQAYLDANDIALRV